MANSPYGLPKDNVRKTPREVYNEALEAYIDNKSYKAPDGRTYEGRALKGYLESVVQGEKLTNPQRSTGIRSNGKNKASVKGMTPRVP